MQHYRVKGAHRDTGGDFDEVILALSESEAIEQANRRGVLVNLVKPTPEVAARDFARSSPKKSFRRKPTSWRVFIRTLLWIASTSIVLLGVLVAILSLLDMVSAELGYLDPLEKSLVKLIGPVAFYFGVQQLILGGTVQILLYIERHLYETRLAR